NASESLERVKTVFEPLVEQQHQAVETLEKLTTEYDPQALEDGVGNLEQAKGLLEFGQEKIATAETALNESDRSHAAWNIHEAENTTQELREIYQSVAVLPKHLDKAQRQLNIELQQARHLLTEAKGFASRQHTEGSLSKRIAARSEERRVGKEVTRR